MLISWDIVSICERIFFQSTFLTAICKKSWSVNENFQAKNINNFLRYD